jgi:hypothetical protein
MQAAFLFVCTPGIGPTFWSTYTDALARSYFSTVTSYLRAMASTKCSVLPSECGVKSNGTGPRAGSLQDKVGGVAPDRPFL